MSDVTIELKLSQNEYDFLNKVARKEELSTVDLIKNIINDLRENDLHKEKEELDQRAKALAFMKKLGQGLGEDKPPHDASDNHDKYIYGS